MRPEVRSRGIGGVAPDRSEAKRYYKGGRKLEQIFPSGWAFCKPEGKFVQCAASVG